MEGIIYGKYQILNPSHLVYDIEYCISNWF